MIICSCAHVTSGDVTRAVEWMRAADPQAVVTPGKVYRALGKRPECGGCMRLFVGRVRAALREDMNDDLPTELRDLRGVRRKESPHERRREGH